MQKKWLTYLTRLKFKSAPVNGQARRLKASNSAVPVYLKILPLAIALVNKWVARSEAAGHHPARENSYNKVTLNLTTHDAGGLTEKDLACRPRDFYARLKEFLLVQQELLYLETVPARGKLANKKSTRG
jgi:hypothetical protein